MSVAPAVPRREPVPSTAAADRRRSVAVVGGGIAGLIAARELHDACDVVLYEAAPRLGGHARTIDVEHEGRSFAVDTGFVVFNPETYPGLTALFATLGVATQPTDMSFGVRCERTGLEYSGTGPRGLFAQPANALRPSFHRLLAEIVRFNRRAARDVAADRPEALDGTVRDWLRRGGFSAALAERYVVPLGAAIWSAPPAGLLDFPARFFLGFLANHRLLQVRDQLAWRTVAGGSRGYVEPLVRPFRDRVRLGAAVRRVRRLPGGPAAGVELTVAGEPPRRFDEVVLAVHADRALALLDRPTRAEREVLGAFRFQPNRAVLHTDVALLPRRRAARASWNVLLPPDPRRPVVATYDLSRLQRLPTRAPLLLTLNAEERVDPARVLDRCTFAHPQFDLATPAAQARHAEISGADRIHYCGAWWRNGFHEDGLVSARAAVARLRRAA